MNVRRTAALFVTALAVAGSLAACSDGTSDSTANEQTPSASAPMVQGSPTDIAFAQSMIPHHQQAVEMADLALNPQSGASEQIQQLAEQIKAAQDPEIAQMTQWLQDWGAPTAMPGATGPDMAGMDHGSHDMGGVTMSGMMTAEQMQELQQSQGEAFDEMWLSMMIAHHEGAISMAEQAQASNSSQVTTMTEAIISGQQEEIVTMQELLAEKGQ